MKDGQWIDERIEANRERLTAWMVKKRAEVPIPIYGSVDVRDAGWKVAAVDANHFPAGFNNVPEEDRSRLSELLREHVERTSPGVTWVHLYPESHTRNPGYVENLRTLVDLLVRAGYLATVGSPELNDVSQVRGLSGHLDLVNVQPTDVGGLVVNGRKPDLVLLNNDLTTGLPDELQTGEIMPPTHMGWHRRRKSEHQRALEPYVVEAAALLDLDPWYLQTEWFVSKDKCLEKETCRTILAAEVDAFLDGLRERYASLGIDQEPVAFVKNDRGTYGLGIMTVRSGSELLELSNRKMKRLMYAKGGADVENFLVQEGVPTSMTAGTGVAEPVVYLVDGEAASWFYRTNEKKGTMDNLNSPSSSFLSAAEVGPEAVDLARGRHALVAELSMLAMGAERLASARRT